MNTLQNAIMTLLQHNILFKKMGRLGGSRGQSVYHRGFIEAPWGQIWPGPLAVWPSHSPVFPIT